MCQGPRRSCSRVSGTDSRCAWRAEPGPSSGRPDSSREGAQRPRRGRSVRQLQERTRLHASPRPIPGEGQSRPAQYRAQATTPAVLEVLTGIFSSVPLMTQYTTASASNGDDGDEEHRECRTQRSKADGEHGHVPQAVKEHGPDQRAGHTAHDVECMYRRRTRDPPVAREFRNGEPRSAFTRCMSAEQRGW